MAFWWLVKRYGDEPIRVTEKAAQAVQEAKTRGDSDIRIKGAMYATKSISAIEPSTERIEEENIYLLGDGIIETDIKPILAPDYEHNGVKYQGGVICNWYKKAIDPREWAQYYASSPGYHRFDDPNKSVWVAMLLPEVRGLSKALHLELCNDEEAKYLDRKRRT